MDKLGLKDLSHDLSENCAISFFRLHLVLHACIQRCSFTVEDNFFEN
jgi:hypothetical protein